MKKTKILFIILILLIIGVLSLIAIKEYSVHKKECERMKEEWKKENFKISLVFDLDTTKKIIYLLGKREEIQMQS